MSALWFVLIAGAPTAFTLWLTRNEYDEGYQAGYFDASHGIPAPDAADPEGSQR